jgi:DNA-binding MarR family transcriptional regulator
MTRAQNALVPTNFTLKDIFSHSDIRQPADNIGFLMWQVTHAWQRHLDEALQPAGLTHLQFVVLVSTGWHVHLGETVSQAGLARWMKIHPMQVSQVVKLLLAKSLLRREKIPNDARAHRLLLSTAGIQTLANAVPLVNKAHHIFFEDASGIEAPLKKLLSRLFETRAS